MNTGPYHVSPFGTGGSSDPYHSGGRLPVDLDPRRFPPVRTLIVRWNRLNGSMVRASRRSRESEHSARWRQILTDGPCAYCGATAETVDHVRPVALGGRSLWTNLTGACAACNGDKASTPMLLWLLYRARARQRAADLAAVQSKAQPVRFGLLADRLAAAIRRSA